MKDYILNRTLGQLYVSLFLRTSNNLISFKIIFCSKPHWNYGTQDCVPNYGFCSWFTPRYNYVGIRVYLVISTLSQRTISGPREIILKIRQEVAQIQSRIEYYQTRENLPKKDAIIQVHWMFEPLHVTYKISEQLAQSSTYALFGFLVHQNVNLIVFIFRFKNFSHCKQQPFF